MIREVILTTISESGVLHIAPMGVHDAGDEKLVMPFRPSATLDNILATGHAVMNQCDDVRIFAGCLTGRRDWPSVEAELIAGKRLAGALGHTELKLERVEEDPVRPRLFCRVVYEASHAPFRGFNRAQYSVLEAAILVSRLHMLPENKIRQELDYLAIGLEKTAGPTEREAWGWLMARVESTLGQSAIRNGEPA